MNKPLVLLFLVMLLPASSFGQEFFELDATAGALDFAPKGMYGRTVVVSSRPPNFTKALEKRARAVEQYAQSSNLKWARKVYRYNSFFVKTGFWKKSAAFADILPKHQHCVRYPRQCKTQALHP